MAVSCVFDTVMFKFLLFISLVTLVSSIPRVEASCSFRAIFNFGDSNSETGGFWAAFPAQHLPFGMTYFKKPAGRASDGRAVIDFLGKIIEHHKLKLIPNRSSTCSI